MWGHQVKYQIPPSLSLFFSVSQTNENTNTCLSDRLSRHDSAPLDCTLCEFSSEPTKTLYPPTTHPHPHFVLCHNIHNTDLSINGRGKKANLIQNSFFKKRKKWPRTSFSTWLPITVIFILRSLFVALQLSAVQIWASLFPVLMLSFVSPSALYWHQNGALLLQAIILLLSPQEGSRCHWSGYQHARWCPFRKCSVWCDWPSEVAVWCVVTWRDTSQPYGGRWCARVRYRKQRIKGSFHFHCWSLRLLCGCWTTEIYTLQV